MSETTSEKRILSKEEVTRTVKSKNPVSTYAMIEWKKLYRTPAWFMNCVLMPLIWPVFMLGIALVSVISSLGMAKTTGLWTRLVADGTIFRLLKGELPVAVAVLTAAGIAVMMSMFCVISATAMSRKGSEYIYMKCIPMSYHDQIRAMLVSGILISLLGTLPYALVFNIIAVVFGLHPATLLYTTAITVLFTLFVNYEQLLFDLAFPKLNWENETAAIKIQQPLPDLRPHRPQRRRNPDRSRLPAVRKTSPQHPHHHERDDSAYRSPDLRHANRPF